jgi:hypothetical protein
MVTPEADWNVQTFTDLTMSIAANSLDFVGRSQQESTAILTIRNSSHCSYHEFVCYSHRLEEKQR